MIRPFFLTLGDRWANLHPFIRFVLLSAVLAGLGWLVMKPSYQGFKAWRMQRNLAAARQAIAEQRMDDARDLSLTVLRAGDPHLEAYQILEKATAALRNPMHGDIARALMAHPQSTDEDRLNGFRGIASEVAMGLLGQSWASLSAECQQDRRFALVFADRLIAERRLSEAATILLAVPEAARDSAVQRRLIRVLISSGKRDGYDEAQRMIATQMPATATAAAAAEQLEWLDLLETIPVPSLQEKLLAPLRGLLDQPDSANAARMDLMLTRIDYAANFSKAADIIDAAIARWQQRDPVALAAFLGDLGLYRRLLDTLPSEFIQAHPGLFHRMLQAMEHCDAWSNVIELLDKGGDLIPKFEELAHRAIAAARTADATTRSMAWAAAMADAKASATPGAYLKIQRLASDAGMTEEAEQAMVAAIQLGRGPLPLYSELKPLLTSLARQGRDNTLLEICASYMVFEPGNPVLLTQFAYLACLYNVIESKTIIKAMHALADGFPNDLTIQCVMATAYLCDGQAAEAATIFDRLELDLTTLTPGFRASYLTTQVLTQRISVDDPHITGFPWKSAQPCERKKFNDLLRGTQSDHPSAIDK